MKAVNIQWDVDSDEIIERLNDTELSELASLLQVSEPQLAVMEREERSDLAMDRFRHAPALLDRFLDLPDEVAIPQEFENAYESEDERDEAITEYLSDEYGYCINSYGLE